jgi:exosortase A-associated hydrolase 1
MRRLIAIPCEGETLVATLDDAAGATGLLIVSGGNEIRSGAHRGMAMVARRLAAGGTPVFRYDRRGIGDSSGENGGFLSGQADLVAAAAAFRAAVPHVTRLVGFGNCDAASALALFGGAAGVDRLLLANPWVIAPTDDLPPAAAIRARYAARLRDPAAWFSLIRGGIDLRKLVRGLVRLSRASGEVEGDLASQVCGAIDGWAARVVILLATGDVTAQVFAARYRGAARIVRLATDSHSFVGAANTAALEATLRAVIDGTDDAQGPASPTSSS